MKKTLIRIFLLAGVIVLASCRNLQVNDNDSTPLSIAKISGRVGVDVITLGLAEIEFHDLRVMEENELNRQIAIADFKKAMDSWLDVNREKLIGQLVPPLTKFLQTAQVEKYMYIFPPIILVAIHHPIRGMTLMQ